MNTCTLYIFMCIYLYIYTHTFLYTRTHTHTHTPVCNHLFSWQCSTVFCAAVEWLAQAELGAEILSLQNMVMHFQRGPTKGWRRRHFLPWLFHRLLFFIFLNFIFLASQFSAQHIEHVSRTEEMRWTRDIKNTTGVLGCPQGSRSAHLSSSGNSETCRDSFKKKKVYVPCTLIMLSRWMCKALLLV